MVTNRLQIASRQHFGHPVGGSCLSGSAVRLEWPRCRPHLLNRPTLREFSEHCLCGMTYVEPGLWMERRLGPARLHCTRKARAGQAVPAGSAWQRIPVNDGDTGTPHSCLRGITPVPIAAEGIRRPWRATERPQRDPVRAQRWILGLLMTRPYEVVRLVVVNPPGPFGWRQRVLQRMRSSQTLRK